MKKLLSALIFFLIPSTSFAAFPIAWNATSSNASFIQPNNINGIIQALKISGIATSTINKLEVGNLNVTTGATMPVSLSLSGFTQGSALFVGPSGSVNQDNSNFYWDDTNNRLGIGTSSPRVAFHVGNGGAASLPDGAGSAYTPQVFNSQTSGIAGIGVVVNDGTANRRIGLFMDQTNGVAGISSSYSSGDFPFVYRDASGEKFRISATGNVGIGTTNPTSKLDIYNANSTVNGMSFYGTDNSNRKYAQVYTTANEGSFALYNSDGSTVGIRLNGGTAVSTYFNGGNVGVGTTTPANKLVVQSTSDDVVRITNFSANSNPAIVLQNDAESWNIQNTGARSDNFEIYDVGSGAVRFAINQSGNVGIGTTSPSNIVQTLASTGPRFDVTGTSDNSVLTLNQRNGYDTNAGNYIAFTQGSGASLTQNGRFGYIGSGTRNGFYFQNGSNNTLMNVLANGNVAIGTTTPRAALHIASTNQSLNHGLNNFPQLGVFTNATTQVAEQGGQIDLGTYNAGLSQPYAFASIKGITEGNSGNSGALILGTTASDSTITERLRITSTGNVGIGSTSPNTLLVVGGGAGSGIRQTVASYPGILVTPNSANGQVSIGTTGNIQGGIMVDNGGSVYSGAWTNNNYVLRTNNSDVITLTAGGNVGIGTTSPVSKLHVSVSNLTNAAAPQLPSDSGLVIDDTNAPNIQFRSNTTGTNYVFFGDDDADVGSLRYDHTSNLMGFRVNAADRMVIDSSGNVGIGSTTPWAQLSVNPNGVPGPAFAIGSSTRTSFIVSNGGKVAVGTTTSADFASGLIVTGAAQSAVNAGSNPNNYPLVVMAGGSGSNDAGLIALYDNRANNGGYMGGIGISGSGNGLKLFNRDSATTFIADRNGVQVVPLAGQTAFLVGSTTNYFIVKDTGNVGIGTTSPAMKLDVYGQMRAISPTLPTCTSALYGAIQYDVSADNFYGCKTTGWVILN